MRGKQARGWVGVCGLYQKVHNGRREEERLHSEASRTGPLHFRTARNSSQQMVLQPCKLGIRQSESTKMSLPQFLQMAAINGAVYREEDEKKRKLSSPTWEEIRQLCKMGWEKWNHEMNVRNCFHNLLNMTVGNWKNEAGDSHTQYTSLHIYYEGQTI